jgi:hypothetical protein
MVVRRNTNYTWWEVEIQFLKPWQRYVSMVPIGDSLIDFNIEWLFLEAMEFNKKLPLNDRAHNLCQKGIADPGQWMRPGNPCPWSSVGLHHSTQNSHWCLGLGVTHRPQVPLERIPLPFLSSFHGHLHPPDMIIMCSTLCQPAAQSQSLTCNKIGIFITTKKDKEHFISNWKAIVKIRWSHLLHQKNRENWGHIYDLIVGVTEQKRKLSGSPKRICYGKSRDFNILVDSLVE